MTLLTRGVIPHPVLHQLMSTSVISGRMRTQGSVLFHCVLKYPGSLSIHRQAKRLYLDLEFPKIPILKTSERKTTVEQLEERGNNTAITSQLKQTDLGISPVPAKTVAV